MEISELIHGLEKARTENEACEALKQVSSQTFKGHDAKWVKAAVLKTVSEWADNIGVCREGLVAMGISGGDGGVLLLVMERHVDAELVSSCVEHLKAMIEGNPELQEELSEEHALLFRVEEAMRSHPVLAPMLLDLVASLSAPKTLEQLSFSSLLPLIFASHCSPPSSCTARIFLNLAKAGLLTPELASPASLLHNTLYFLINPQSPLDAAASSALALVHVLSSAEYLKHADFCSQIFIDTLKSCTVNTPEEGFRHGFVTAIHCLHCLLLLMGTLTTVHASFSTQEACKKVISYLARGSLEPDALKAMLKMLASFAFGSALYQAVLESDAILVFLSQEAESQQNTHLVLTVVSNLAAHGEQAQQKLGNFGWVPRVLSLYKAHKTSVNVVRVCLRSFLSLCKSEEGSESFIAHSGVQDFITVVLEDDPRDLKELKRDCCELVSILSPTLTGNNLNGEDRSALLAKVVFRNISNNEGFLEAGLQAVSKLCFWQKVAEELCDTGILKQLRKVRTEGREVAVAYLQVLSALSQHDTTVHHIHSFIPRAVLVVTELSSVKDTDTPLLLEAYAQILYAVTSLEGPEVFEKVEVPMLKPFGMNMQVVKGCPSMAIRVCQTALQVAKTIHKTLLVDASTAAAFVSCIVAGNYDAASIIAKVLSRLPGMSRGYFVATGGLAQGFRLLKQAAENDLKTGIALSLLSVCNDVTDVSFVESLLDDEVKELLMKCLGLDEMELRAANAASSEHGSQKRSTDAWLTIAHLTADSTALRTKVAPLIIGPVTSFLSTRLAEPPYYLLYALGSALLYPPTHEHIPHNMLTVLFKLAPSKNLDKVTALHTGIAYLALCLVQVESSYKEQLVESGLDYLMRNVLDHAEESFYWGRQVQGKAKTLVGELKQIREEKESKDAVVANEDAKVLGDIDTVAARGVVDEQQEERNQTRKEEVAKILNTSDYEFTMDEAEMMVADDAFAVLLDTLAGATSVMAACRCFACLVVVVARHKDLTPAFLRISEAITQITQHNTDAELAVRSLQYFTALAEADTTDVIHDLFHLVVSPIVSVLRVSQEASLWCTKLLYFYAKRSFPVPVLSLRRVITDALKTDTSNQELSLSIANLLEQEDDNAARAWGSAGVVDALAALLAKIDDISVEAKILRGIDRCVACHAKLVRDVASEVAVQHIVSSLIGRWNSIEVTRPSSSILKHFALMEDAVPELSCDYSLVTACNNALVSTGPHPVLTDIHTKANLLVPYAVFSSRDLEGVKGGPSVFVAVLQEVLASPHCEEVIATVLRAVEIHSFSSTLSQGLATAGLLPLLVSFMDAAHDSSTDIVCLAIFANLSSVASLVALVSASGCLQTAVALLNNTTAACDEACRLAAFILGNTIGSQAGWDAFNANEGCHAMQHAMEVHVDNAATVEVLSNAMLAYGRTSLEGMQCADGAVCIPIMVKALLAHRQVTTVAALESLVRQNQDCQKVFVSTGSKALVSLLQTAGDDTVRYLALAASFDELGSNPFANQFMDTCLLQVQRDPASITNLVRYTSQVALDSQESREAFMNSPLLPALATGDTSNNIIELLHAILGQDSTLKVAMGCKVIEAVVNRLSKKTVDIQCLELVELLLESDDVSKLAVDTNIGTTLAEVATKTSNPIIVKTACTCLSRVPATGWHNAESMMTVIELVVRAAAVNQSSHELLGAFFCPLSQWSRDAGTQTHTFVDAHALLKGAHSMLLHAIASNETNESLTYPLLYIGARLCTDDIFIEQFQYNKVCGLKAFLSVIPGMSVASHPAQALGWCLAVAVLWDQNRSTDGILVDKVTAGDGAMLVGAASQSNILDAGQQAQCLEALKCIDANTAMKTVDPKKTLEEVADELRRTTADLEVYTQKAAKLQKENHALQKEIAESLTKEESATEMLSKVQQQLEIKLDVALSETQMQHNIEIQALEKKHKAELDAIGDADQLRQELLSLRMEMSAAEQAARELADHHMRELATLNSTHEAELKKTEERYQEKEQLVLKQKEWEVQELGKERAHVKKRGHLIEEQQESDFRKIHTTNVENKARVTALEFRFKELALENAELTRRVAEYEELSSASSTDLIAMSKKWEESLNTQVGIEKMKGERFAADMKLVYESRVREVTTDADDKVLKAHGELGFERCFVHLREEQAEDREQITGLRKSFLHDLKEEKIKLLHSWRDQQDGATLRKWEEKVKAAEKRVQSREVRRAKILQNRLTGISREAAEQGLMASQDWNVWTSAEAWCDTIAEREMTARSAVLLECKEALGAIKKQNARTLHMMVNTERQDVWGLVRQSFEVEKRHRESMWQSHADIVEKQAAEKVKEMQEMFTVKETRLRQELQSSEVAFEKYKKHSEEMRTKQKQKHAVLSTDLAKAHEMARVELRSKNEEIVVSRRRSRASDLGNVEVLSNLIKTHEEEKETLEEEHKAMVLKLTQTIDDQQTFVAAMLTSTHEALLSAERVARLQIEECYTLLMPPAIVIQTIAETTVAGNESKIDEESITSIIDEMSEEGKEAVEVSECEEEEEEEVVAPRDFNKVLEGILNDMQNLSTRRCETEGAHVVNMHITLKQQYNALKREVDRKERAENKVMEGMVLTHEKEMQDLKELLSREQRLNEELKSKHGREEEMDDVKSQLATMKTTYYSVQEKKGTLECEVTTLKKKLQQTLECEKGLLRRCDHFDVEREQLTILATAAKQAQKKLEEEICLLKNSAADTLHSSQESAQAASHIQGVLSEKCVTLQTQVSTLQEKLRRKLSYQGKQEAAEAVLRDRGIEECLQAWKDMCVECTELEEALIDMKCRRDVYKKERDDALKELETAVERENSAIEKYVKLLSAKEGVKQREKDLERHAWVLSIQDKELEKKQSLLELKEVDFYKTIHSHGRRLDPLPQTVPLNPQWMSKTLQDTHDQLSNPQHHYIHGKQRLQRPVSEKHLHKTV